MGFGDILGKTVNGAVDLMAKMAVQNAKHIARMSDEEIEKKYFKPARMIRKDAATLSDFELKEKYSRPADEVRRDVKEMSDEDLEIKYSKFAKEVRMDAERLRFQAEMYQMKKKKQEKCNKGELTDFD